MLHLMKDDTGIHIDLTETYFMLVKEIKHRKTDMRNLIQDVERYLDKEGMEDHKAVPRQ